MKRFIVLFLFVFSNFCLLAQEPNVSLSTIHDYMDTIFEEHVSQKKMSTVLMARAIDIFINQFDHLHTYLLRSEVEPYLTLSHERLQALVADYENSRYTIFEELSQLFQRAIRRQRAIRVKIHFDGYSDVDEKLETAPYDLTENLPFAMTLDELALRVQILVATLLHNKEQQNIDFQQAVKQVEYELQEKENEYLYLNMYGGPLSFKDKNELFASHILKALTASLDAHSTFYNPGEANVLKMTLQKSFSGIGIGFEMRGRNLIINQIIKGSPAEKSGQIQVNDELLAINGEPVANMDLEKILEKLQGTVGEGVTLTLKREEEGLKPEVFSVALTRQNIELKEGRVETDSVAYDDGIIGIIKLHAFYDGEGNVSSVEDMKKALQDLSQKGKLIGLVLDLRDNHGGFLVQAVDVAGLFIKTGVIVISKTADGEEHFYRDIDPAKYFSGPFVILTSKETASAAEIVAEALKDYGVAIIVGDEHTFGKGSIQMQTITGSAADASFKVTVGRYYSVSGKSIQKTGVSSDIVVPSIYFNRKIGEEYLENPLSSDSVPPVFKDPLTDIAPDKKEWYKQHYLPFLEVPTDEFRQYIPELQKRSEARLDENSEYQQFLKGLPLQKTEMKDGKEEEVTLSPEETEKLVNKLQLDEAVNIVEDLIDLSQKKEQ